MFSSRPQDHHHGTTGSPREFMVDWGHDFISSPALLSVDSEIT